MEDELMQELEGIVNNAAKDMSIERKTAHISLMPAVQEMLFEQVIEQKHHTQGTHIGFLIETSVDRALEHGAKHANGNEVSAEQVASGDFVGGQMRYFNTVPNPEELFVLLTDTRASIASHLALPNCAMMVSVVKNNRTLTTMIAANAITVSVTDKSGTVSDWAELLDGTKNSSKQIAEIAKGLSLSNTEQELLRNMLFFKAYPMHMRREYPTAYEVMVKEITEMREAYEEGQDDEDI